MRVLVIGLIVLALSVAGISTYLIQNFSTPEAIGELEKKSRPVVNQVLVAKLALNPGAVINRDAVVWREWPTDSMNENYISVTEEADKDGRFKEVVDSRVRRLVNAGEPVMASKLFKSDKPGFMAGVVEKGMRAMAISINPLTGAAGFVLPGDHVDVLLVHDQVRAAMQQINKEKAALAQGENTETTETESEPKQIEILRTATEIVLEDILVLAVNQSTGPIEGQSIPAKTLLFELTPKQVQILTTAQTMGSLSVTLRNVGDVAGEAGGGAEYPIMSYTTDVEVSTFIRKLTAEAVGESLDTMNKRAAEEAAASEASEATSAQQQEIEALRQQLEEVKKSAQTATVTKPKKKKAETLEIYRGGAAQTEVIQVQ
jgi:pilus assembly protein CpaB